MKLIVWIAYWAVGGVFAYSGLVKILAPDEFLSSILTYEVFPYTIAAGVSLMVPYLELFVGPALIANVYRPGAALVIWGMLAAFLVLIVQGWVRGLDIDCGCFGSGDAGKPSYPWLVGRDLLLMLGMWIGGWAARVLKNRSTHSVLNFR